MVNVILGTPYEELIMRIIRQGYAGTQTEAIRQALLAYEKVLAEREEALLVKKGVGQEMRKIRSGKVKTRPLAQAARDGVFD